MNQKKLGIILISSLTLNSCTKGEPEGISLVFTIVLGIIFVIAAFRTMFAEDEENQSVSGIVGLVCLIAALLILA
ncbi:MULTISPECIES: hypothetical protein [Flavobacteriaceae]|uniref:hypothetical protein n=1 Tax=Flavobacteriaceae TaxID=49546 RepID=UPI0014927BDC|nr:MULTISPECIES: hypothetical protein [Allomuricauda]MDC6367237.1 hypothetical protein [Muricauda sp. AC10]